MGYMSDLNYPAGDHVFPRPIPQAEQEEAMPLMGPREMFAAAYAGRYAVGAFNVNNMEIVQGIMRAAAEENPR